MENKKLIKQIHAYTNIYILRDWRHNLLTLCGWGIFPVYLLFSIYAFGFIYIANSMEWHHFIGAYLLFFLIWRCSKKFFLLFVILHSLLAVMYFAEFKMRVGIGLGSIASLLETNPEEIRDYFAILPNEIVRFQVGYLFLTLLVCVFYKKLFYQGKIKKWAYGTLFAVLVGMATYKPILLYKSNDYLKKKKESQVWYLEETGIYVIARPAYLGNLIWLYHQEQSQFDAINQQKSSWQIKEATPKYPNYVLIIGESMRKDYLSLYGYPLPTTPFLSKANGVFVDGYVSSAGYTAVSLERSLYMHDKIKNQTNYPDNIITLAQKAGFKTYWLSNQNRWGLRDNAAARIGRYTHQQVFLRNKAYLQGKDTNVSDMLLLPELQNFISQPSSQPRLFILHLYGSHDEVCQRVKNRQISFNLINKSLSCYLESLKQTDELIEQVTQIMAQHGGYSLLYFSDHGQNHHNKEKENVILLHGTNHKQNYEVPLLKISSDDTEHKIIKTRRSAFHFMNGFAEWLSIDEPSLRQNHAFFSETPDDDKIQVFNGNKIVDFDGLADDPVLKP